MNGHGCQRAGQRAGLADKLSRSYWDYSRHLTHLEVRMVDYGSLGGEVHGANDLHGTGKDSIPFRVQLDPLEHAVQVVAALGVARGEVLLPNVLGGSGESQLYQSQIELSPTYHHARIKHAEQEDGQRDRPEDVALAVVPHLGADSGRNDAALREAEEEEFAHGESDYGED